MKRSCLFFVLFVIVNTQDVTVDKTTGFRVTVENLSGGTPLPSGLSPIVWAVHSGVTPLFNPRQRASLGLQDLAEDGVPTLLLQEVRNDTVSPAGVSSSGVAYNNPGDRSGTNPGAVTQWGVVGAPGDRLSFVTMYVQTNDRFFGTSQDGFMLFDENNNPRSGVVDVIMYDAGTEINERPGFGINQAPRQPRTNVGQNENSVVMRAEFNNDGFTYYPIRTLLRVTITASTSFRFKVDNLSGGSSQPTALSPLLWVVHQHENVFFTAGQKATAGLKMLAESGDTSLLAEETMNKTGILQWGTTPAVPPGGSLEFQATIPQGAFFSFATMFVASNDRFYAPNPRGVNLFHSTGAVSGDISNVELWDAGTEVNQAPGAGSNQPANGPGGQPEDGVVLNALAQNDGFTYPDVRQVIHISAAPVSGIGFTRKTFDQKLNVQFVFSNMFKTMS